MKQHITPKQLNELSEKGKEKLRKWLEKHPLEYKFTVGKPSAILSIGKMIEFLGDDKAAKAMLTGWEQDNLGWEGQCLDLVHIDKLCDALWKAVKKVLEKGS